MGIMVHCSSWKESITLQYIILTYILHAAILHVFHINTFRWDIQHSSVSNKCKRYICMSLYYKGFIVKKYRSRKVNKNKYTLGWINCLKEKNHVKVLLSHVWLFTRPWTVAHQTPLSVKFFRQEYWSGLPFPSPGDLPDPGIEPGSPTLLVDSLPFEPSIQFSSVVQSCPALGDCSTPGLSVHHQLPELTQTHVHQVGDVIQPP